MDNEGKLTELNRSTRIASELLDRASIEKHTELDFYGSVSGYEALKRNLVMNGREGYM